MVSSHDLTGASRSARLEFGNRIVGSRPRTVNFPARMQVRDSSLPRCADDIIPRRNHRAEVAASFSRLFVSLLLLFSLSVQPATGSRPQSHILQNAHSANSRRPSEGFQASGLIPRHLFQEIIDNHLAQASNSQRGNRGDLDQRRRKLYDADAAIRALHHHHLPSGSGGGGGGGSYSSTGEEDAFSSSFCWSVTERRYYQSPYSTTTRMSDALFERIQRYTKMHSACTVPVSDWPAFFNDPTQGLSSNATADSVADCKYLLWQEPTWNGLGNQLLSLVSSFVYALLTNRVLLLSPASFCSRLLCNPFPHSSWRPPALSAEDFDLMSAVAKNHMVGRMGIDDGARGEQGEKRPAAAFSDLSCRANVSDFAFYCSKVQKQISAVRFLGLDTEEYILPALYVVPEFDAELERLFPDRLPLMHISRYLLHPANYLWEEITRAFRAYLAPYQHRVGIQIRDFTSDTGDEKHVIKRMMQCAVNITRGLPPLLEHSRWKSIMNGELTPTAAERHHLHHNRQGALEGSVRSIGVLVASLKRVYTDAIHDAYVEGVPLGGYDVAVTSLSHESGQTFGEERQLELALKEMWLLSMCDLLLVSDTSTFGYMAAGLAGVSPFSLNVVRRMGSNWDVNGRPECEITTPEPCYLSMLEPHQQQIQCPGEPPKSPLEMSSKIKYCPNYKIGVVLDVPNPEQYESFKQT